MNNVKMLTIDLLKGRGIPVRSNPDNIATMMVMLEIPVIVTIMMLGYYLHSDVVISIREQKIVNYERKIEKLSEAAALQEAVTNEKETIDSCLSEVAATINKHTQWTPVLIEIVENIPDSILLTGIDIKQGSVKKKVPSRDGNGGDVEVVVPVGILRINVREKSGFNHEQSIRDFEDSLRSSAVLGPQLDNINVSQGVDTLKGQDVVSYQIDCAFKPRL
jgi:Tfp pilus assembly protein PilN